MDRGRNWTFTLNNYTPEDVEKLKVANFHYLIFGKEVGEQGTPHLQGYCIFNTLKSFSQVKNILGDKFHIEKAKSKAEFNITYCSKSGDVFESGNRPRQGSRTDIENVKSLVKSGVTLDKIVMEATSYQSARHAELLYKYKSMPLPREKHVVWYYGPTGSGKTREAFDYGMREYPESVWISGKDFKWFQGYFGQKFCIIDDFRGDFCTFHFLLRVIDRYPLQVELKGSSMWWDPDVIVFTSCYRPEDVYETREDISQLLRRISVIQEFK